MSFHVPETDRIKSGPLASDPSYGNNGAFLIRGLLPYRLLAIVASDGLGWEHASVHVTDGKARQWTPNWDEMCHVKNLFWDAEDVVIQYHPRRSEYVSYHEHTLHLWRPTGFAIPTPDPELVGPLAITASVRP